MSDAAPVAILLNGPLGIGKTTLGEVLGEAIDRSVTLDGDAFAALNPPPADEFASLHAALALLVGHHFAAGYRRFIIDHYWPTAGALGDLAQRLQDAAPGIRICPFRLTLSRAANLERIARRQSARAIDEAEFEAQHFAEEYALLTQAKGDELGVPFDASDPPRTLAARIMDLLGLPAAT